jgi:tRNA-uridine 2-sulfurtransferase
MNRGSVLVALSGGVDSSYAAYLLKESGYDLHAITMLLGSGDSFSRVAEEAAEVSKYLGIEHRVVDLSKEFKEQIIDCFIAEYLKGRTPNPCVACNRYFKFDILYNESLKLGFDLFATGHFAGIEQDNSSGYSLKKGRDPLKDQSYFLYPIERDYLSRIIFPLGDCLKSDIFDLAVKAGIPFSQRGSSQDICFIGGNDYKDFIKRNTHDLESGDIVDKEGNILGRHSGVPFYTIGQREGLGIAASSALYVIDIDWKKNSILVGEREDLKSRELIASEVNILNADLSNNISAKIRYKHPAAKCEVEKLENKRLKVIFRDYQYAVTPGQSVVFYRDDTLLAGGIIEEVIS